MTDPCASTTALSKFIVVVMQHPNTLDPKSTVLVIIDMQEGFRGAIAEFDSIAKRIAIVAQAATLLGVPIVVTEQYPKGLKHTVESLRAVLPADVVPIEKTAFSSCGASAFVDRLAAIGARQVLLCGIEAHVCVNMTAHDLLARGYGVHLLADCISSRTPENRELGLGKMLASGAIRCGVEMAVFELMRDAKHEQFKAVQRLIK